jgi:decaprenylphospho-beta-D-erythro-pentofuranosid-2-ulose 2-reductase
MKVQSVVNKILIVGATSAIAEATARLYAKQGHKLFLIARNEDRLLTMIKDLKIRGASQAHYGVLNVNDLSRHADMLDRAVKTLSGIDIALIAHGTLPDQRACELNLDLTLQEISTNAVSTISLMSYLANLLEQQGYGLIAVISSVAGDRGRQSNYIYGTAKSAVSTFSQGLRNRLYKSGVHVMTIKPGFVDTPMTKDFKKGVLWAQPHDIATGITQGIEKKRDILYLPWFWRIIMAPIKLIPERLFKMLNL